MDGLGNWGVAMGAAWLSGLKSYTLGGDSAQAGFIGTRRVVRYLFQAALKLSDQAGFPPQGSPIFPTRRVMRRKSR
jgi:hypothetical protein